MLFSFYFLHCLLLYWLYFIISFPSLIILEVIYHFAMVLDPLEITAYPLNLPKSNINYPVLGQCKNFWNLNSIYILSRFISIIFVLFSIYPHIYQCHCSSFLPASQTFYLQSFCLVQGFKWQIISVFVGLKVVTFILEGHFALAYNSSLLVSSRTLLISHYLLTSNVSFEKLSFLLFFWRQLILIFLLLFQFFFAFQLEYHDMLWYGFLNNLFCLGSLRSLESVF